MILQDINNKTSFHTKIKNIFFLGERIETETLTLLVIEKEKLNLPMAYIQNNNTRRIHYLKQPHQ